MDDSEPDEGREQAATRERRRTATTDDDAATRLDTPSVDGGRRDALKLLGGAVAVPAGVGALAYEADRWYPDTDGDGIPDSLERSASFRRFLEATFGAAQVEVLDPERKDLLLDVRYVGTASISERTKATIEELFRDNGISLQWLDYPDRYDHARFESAYGYDVKRILSSPRSVYHATVERALKDVALQLFVVPDRSTSGTEIRLNSVWADLRGRRGEFAGVSVGNRALVVQQDRFRSESRLVLHEIAHLALCHDAASENVGVMSTTADNTELDLMDGEWAALRDGLDNVRNTTEFDVTFRGCLWREFARELVE